MKQIYLHAWRKIWISLTKHKIEFFPEISDKQNLYFCLYSRKSCFSQRYLKNKIWILLTRRKIEFFPENIETTSVTMDSLKVSNIQWQHRLPTVWRDKRLARNEHWTIANLLACQSKVIFFVCMCRPPEKRYIRRWFSIFNSLSQITSLDLHSSTKATVSKVIRFSHRLSE